MITDIFILGLTAPLKGRQEKKTVFETYTAKHHFVVFVFLKPLMER